MIIVSYDISDDKKRARFNKFIRKFGYRIQYSVYQIHNSNKILDNIITQIENVFCSGFDNSDSIFIFKMSSSCRVIKYGYAVHEDTDLIIVNNCKPRS